jgi:Protein of unknown function (DUF3306)
MSEPENFIARWSRRKREAAEDAETTKASVAPEGVADGARAGDDERKPSDAPTARSDAREPREPSFDPTRLPPIETITAESDIRAFLAPGVPPELTRAALRRAWAADPKIRDFVGLADYDWDFNAPGAMTGFGSLEMTDELRREVARMVGRSLGAEDAEKPAPAPATPPAVSPVVETSTESATTTGEVPTQHSQSTRETCDEEPVAADNRPHNSEPASQRDKEHIAAQYNPEKPDNDQLNAKRPHGRALPK